MFTLSFDNLSISTTIKTSVNLCMTSPVSTRNELTPHTSTKIGHNSIEKSNKRWIRILTNEIGFKSFLIITKLLSKVGPTALKAGWHNK